MEVDYRSALARLKILEEQLLKANEMKQEVEKRSDGLRREVDILN